ncbi:MAG TPA: 3-dehydroquinate synthase [Methylomirabilota bacterium]|nr:3-dehydroquinate synthase [Methylomirabilota bacterium]
MKEVHVNLGKRSYSILIEVGGLASLGGHLRRLGIGSKVACMTEPIVWRLHGKTVESSLREFTLTRIELPSGEDAKQLLWAERAWSACLDAGLDRGSTIVALGGGAVGDLAGFVAATYMRGIAFVQVPTTILAQVDASIGGKAAINHAKAKNLIGAFHQPRLVLIDPALLQTLPDREYRSGLVEVVKHGISLDANYFHGLERQREAILAKDLPVLEEVIAGSCRLKAKIVEADEEEEGGLRALLNYGHTVGHALEAVTNYQRWLHGEAVSIGIAAAARIAGRLGLADLETVERQANLLHSLGLPTSFTRLDPHIIVEALKRDKKAREGVVPFILVPKIGEARLVYDVPGNLVLEVLHDLRAQ